MSLKRTTLALAVALVLGACGGGNDSSSTDSGSTGGTGDTGGTGGTGGSDPTSQSGVFIDAPVAGIHYQTETLSGETDAEGRFDYLPGETVTFSIGGIQLPAVAAGETVTPLTVFDTSNLEDQRVINLARLLQTLDSDGDADNGITITSAAHTAAANMTLDFDVPVDEFDDNTDVNALLANIGITEWVSVDEALDHIKEQLTLAGSWYLNEEDDLVTVTFMTDGTYLIAQAGVAEYGGESGVEYGTYHWDPVSGEITVDVLLDTNGEWGLSHSTSEMTAVRDGDQITFTEAGDPEASVLQRVVTDETNAIVGTWKLDNEDGGMSVFTFLPTGDFMLGETGTADTAGGPGIERGTYTWNANDHSFTREIATETNGEWGLSDTNVSTIEVDGDAMTMNVVEDEIEVFALTRVN